MDRRERAEKYLQQSPRKRELLGLIVNDSLSIVELATALKVSSPSVHQHVEELAQLGLVTRDKVGRRVYVKLTALARELL